MPYEILLDYLLENPNIFTKLPDKFEIVILPDDDHELRIYNLELLDKYSSEDKTFVFFIFITHVTH